MLNRQLNHTDHSPSNIQFPLSLLLIDIERPENLGGILRLADALGVEKIFVTGNSVSLQHPKVKRVARATQEWVDIEIAESTEQIVDRLCGEGVRLIGLELAEKSQALSSLSVQPNQPICLVLGSEAKGIPEWLLNRLTECVFIPMLGKNSSMNLTSACAIATYDITQKLRENKKNE